MKKNNRLVTIFLMVCMVLASGGLLYATMYASSSAAMSAETTLGFFDAPSGIRYSEGSNVFEVYNAVGVSWIASNGWVSTLGKVHSGGTPTQDQTTGVWYTATKTATYFIMCDIVYDALDMLTLQYNEFYNHAFNNGITLLEGGKIEGNGFTLSGFPMRNATKSSALIASNNGIIRNVNMLDATFYRVTEDQQSAGILCAVNEEKGLIDGCEVFGDYGTKKFTNLFGIVAENNGTIKDCINNANLANAKAGETYTAGITEIKTGSNTVNNINNGNITGGGATASTAGIAMCNADISAVLSGNVNNGEQIAQRSASGILGGTIEASSVNATNNVNNGRFKLTQEVYPTYYGIAAEPITPPNKAIVWNSELNVFQVYNAAGFSQIAMGKWISTTGLIADVETQDYKRADGDAEYRIMNDITYSETEADFNEGFSDSTKAPEAKGPIINPSGVVDGGGHTLFNFPIRFAGNTFASTSYVDYSSALFLRMDGTLKRVSLVLSRTVNSNTTGRVGGIAGIGTGQFIKVSVSLEGPNTGWTPDYTTSFYSFVDFLGIPLDESIIPIVLFEDCINFISLNGNSGQPVSAYFRTTASSVYTGETSILNFVRSINYGDMNATGERAHGFGAGTGNMRARYIECFNFGNIVSNSTFTGGIGSDAYLDGDKEAYVDCKNYGNVSGNSYVGGISSVAGAGFFIKLRGCINYGNVSGGSSQSGAIAGTGDATIITDCVNYGRFSNDRGVTWKTGESVRLVAGTTSSVYIHGVNGNMSIDPTAVPAS